MTDTKRTRAAAPAVLGPALRGWTLALALALVALSVHGLLAASPAAAKAPALATVAVDTPLLATPNEGAQALRTLSRGTEVELTGSAAVGYLQVIAGGDYGWVSAQALEVSNRVGIPLATAVAETPILAAPLPDAATLGVVPQGGVVILTGADVGVYAAGSYEGVGGWLRESDLNLPYDHDGFGF